MTASEPAGGIRPDPNRPALLLVDDVEANLIALEAILSSMDCDLILSRSGNDALAQLLRREFAAVVLDAHMPGMDGFEVARYARQHPVTKDVPILFLTAMHPSEDSALRGYGSGAVDFLFKPVNPLVLRSKVQVFVELFVARKQLVAAKTQALELEAARRVAEARRALLKELSEKNAALERARVELEQFAFVAAHDLREPMRIISLHTDILDRKHADQLDERGRSCAQFARDAARRMQRLIDNLDLCASVRRGTFQVAPVDMGELADEVIRRLEGEQEAARGGLRRGPLPVVSGERPQLDKVLHNILDNSIKFRGPEPLLVGISARQEAEEWIFSVEDNGIGIVEGFTERVFQIFQRYHSADQYPGAGVGLSIARSVVHLHGGRIWAQCNTGPGATLCFTLPVSKGGGPDQAGELSPGDAPSS